MSFTYVVKFYIRVAIIWEEKIQGHFKDFLPARRYASAGLCDSDVSGRLSVRPSVRLSHAGIVPSRAKAGS